MNKEIDQFPLNSVTTEPVVALPIASVFQFCAFLRAKNLRADFLTLFEYLLNHKHVSSFSMKESKVLSHYTKNIHLKSIKNVKLVLSTTAIIILCRIVHGDV